MSFVRSMPSTPRTKASLASASLCFSIAACQAFLHDGRLAKRVDVDMCQPLRIGGHLFQFECAPHGRRFRKPRQLS